MPGRRAPAVDLGRRGGEEGCVSPSLSRQLARAAPIVFLLLWSTGFGVASIALRSAGVWTVLTLRYAIVLAVLGPVLLALRPGWPRGWAWGRLVLVGALVQFGYFGANWTALAAGVGVGVSALVGAGQPILAALVAPLWGGARPDRRLWAGLALGVAGCVAVILARYEVAGTAPAGWPLVLAAVSTLSLTAGSIVEKQGARADGPGGAVHPLMAAGVQYAVAGAGCAAMALLTEGGTQAWSIAWSGTFVAALAYLAGANSLVAITLLLWMMARGEVARVSALFFLVPPVAAAEAVVLTGERLPWAAWAGMAVAAGGVALATGRRARD